MTKAYECVQGEGMYITASGNISIKRFMAPLETIELCTIIGGFQLLV